MVQYNKYELKTVVTISALINISYYKLPKNFLFSGESHDFWEFIYADQGELVITAGERRYLLKAGELAFHQPGEFHKFQETGHGGSNVIVVSFVCDSPCMETFRHKILFLNQNEKQCLHNVVKESELSYESFEKAPPNINMKKKTNAPYGSDQLLKTSLEQLIICIHRHDDSIGIRERCIRSNELQNHAAAVKQISTLLETKYDQKLTLDQLAETAGISISQLKRIFKEQTGYSVITYLTRIRIGEAKRLIQESNYTFTQIAEKTGFDNIYYFSRRFKEITGITPSEYALSLKHW